MPEFRVKANTISGSDIRQMQQTNEPHLSSPFVTNAPTRPSRSEIQDDWCLCSLLLCPGSLPCTWNNTDRCRGMNRHGAFFFARSVRQGRTVYLDLSDFAQFPLRWRAAD